MTEERNVSLTQRLTEYIVIGSLSGGFAIYGLLQHPILFEVGALFGAGIGVVIILCLSYLVPQFELAA